MSTAVSGLLFAPLLSSRQSAPPRFYSSSASSLPPAVLASRRDLHGAGRRACACYAPPRGREYGGRETRHFPSGPSERSITRTADQPASLPPSPEMQKCPLHITSPASACIHCGARPSCANIVMWNEWGTSNERINRPRESEPSKRGRIGDRIETTSPSSFVWSAAKSPNNGLSDEPRRNLVAKILGPANLKEEL